MYFPTPDIIGKLVAGKLLQPLNRSYLPNLANVWDSLQDPFYDKGSVYTVPYTVYTTGIGYRTDAVAKKLTEDNPPTEHGPWSEPGALTSESTAPIAPA